MKQWQKLQKDTMMHVAYSDLVHLNGNQIGVLYEKDNYHTIVFTAINYPMP